MLQICDVREMLTRQAALMILLPAAGDLIVTLNTLQTRYRHHTDTGILRGIH